MVFMNDPVAETLTMFVSRLPMETFTIHTGPVPFRVFVSIGEGDSAELIDPVTPTVAPHTIILEDAGLEEAEALVPAGFSLRAYNEFGVMQPIGGDKVSFRFVSNDDDDDETDDEEDTTGMYRDRSCGGKFKDMSFIDNGDGSYRVQYLPTAPGEYNLHVTLNGEPLEDSPFELGVETTYFAPLRIQEPKPQGRRRGPGLRGREPVGVQQALDAPARAGTPPAPNGPHQLVADHRRQATQAEPGDHDHRGLQGGRRASGKTCPRTWAATGGARAGRDSARLHHVGSRRLGASRRATKWSSSTTPADKLTMTQRLPALYALDTDASIPRPALLPHWPRGQLRHRRRAVQDGRGGLLRGRAGLDGRRAGRHHGLRRAHHQPPGLRAALRQRQGGVPPRQRRARGLAQGSQPARRGADPRQLRWVLLVLLRGNRQREHVHARPCEREGGRGLALRRGGDQDVPGALRFEPQRDRLDSSDA